MDDRELLVAFARDGSEAAFESLVKRYVDLVYSAALRQIGDREQARDIAQAVFLILARKAGSLRADTVLAGWFYRTTRFVALEAIRAEKRRKAREASMTEQLVTEMQESPEEVWRKVSPQLDEIMEHLNESDRNALLLRFFQEKSLRELAGVLGVTEEAAKKRVNRALERLRHNLSRRGITSSSSILGAALAAHAVHPAPAAVVSLIPMVACQGTAAISTVQVLTEGALQMIAWSKVKVTAACAAALLLASGTVTVGVRHSQAASEHSRLVDRHNLILSQQAQADARAREDLARLENENTQLREQTQEIHRLRDQVSQLRAQQRQTAASLSSTMLRDAPPEFKVVAETLRELQYERFIAAGQKAMNLQPLSEDDRNGYVPSIDLMKNVGLALRIYATEHGDQFPPTLDPLFEAGQVTEKMKEQLEQGSFEYLVFKDAETKPSLPAVWSRAPDQKGVRILVLNDGSAHLIREPVGVELPGSVKTESSQ